MKFEDKNLENGQGQWLVTIDGEMWSNALKKAKNYLKQNVEVKGFRKGKAPASEVEKQITPVKVYNKAFETLIDQAFNFAVEQNSLIVPFNSPWPAPVKVSDESLTISFTFDLKPDIELAPYKGLKIENLSKEVAPVSVEEIDQAIEQYRQKDAMEVVKPEDATIEKGDIVTFDFEGFIDGKPFKNGDAKNFKLEIGSGQFIPGFEDSMIGLKRGNDQSIKVKFPENYHAEFAGKDAEFKLNINEIAVKELPVVDDEFVKDLAMENVSTVDELKAKIKADLTEQKQTAAKQGYVDRVLMDIIDNSKITLPKSVLDDQIKHLKADFERNIQQQGMTTEQYKEALGLTDEALDEQFLDDARNELNVYLVTSEIIKLENIESSDDEVNAKFNEFAKMYGMEVDQLKTFVQPSQVKTEILNEKLINFLYENN